MEAQEKFDPYHIWLGIPPEEQPPNHYRLLGVALFESQSDVIAGAADRQMGHLRTFQSGKNSAISQKILNEVAGAKLCLLNKEKKAAYDEQLRQQTIPAENVTPTEDVVEESNPWTDIAKPTIQRKTEANKVFALPNRRAAGKRLANLGPMIAVGGTCVLLVVALLVWNSTRPVAKIHQKSTSDKPRQSVEQPKVQSKSNGLIPQKDNPVKVLPKTPLPVVPPPILETAKSATPVETVPSKENSVIETPPVATPVFEAPKDKLIAEKPEKKPEKTETIAEKPLDTPVKKLSVPDEVVQRKITSQIGDIYPISRTKIPADRIKLAGRLFQAAGASSEPNERYVLLRHVHDLACQGGDVVLMFQAIEAMASQFDIQVNEQKGKSLFVFAETATNAEQIRMLFDHSQRVIAQALSENQYAMASDLANDVYRACQRSKEFRKRAIAQRDKVAECCRRHEDRVQAEAKLNSDPNDAKANLVLGRHYCLFGNDWKNGLPYLVKGSDANLQRLAKRELASPKDPNEQVQLADAWWELAQSYNGDEKDSLLLRAGYWYDEARGRLTSGLVRLKADKRVEELSEIRQRHASSDKDATHDLWSDLF